NAVRLLRCRRTRVARVTQPVRTTAKGCKKSSTECSAAGPRWKRDAFALGQSLAERVGARSDRGECAPCATDRGEPARRRSSGCADGGTADLHLHYGNGACEGRVTNLLPLTDMLGCHFP